jgi:hypothetical protein
MFLCAEFINVTKIRKLFDWKFIKLRGTWAAVKSQDMEGTPQGSMYNYVPVNIPVFCQSLGHHSDAEKVSSLLVYGVV